MAYPSGPSGPYDPAGTTGGLTRPPSSPGFRPAQRPADYGAYSRPAPPKRDAPPLPRLLGLAVVVLGLLSYLLSYFFKIHLGELGWAVRFAVLAGLLAAFDLAPKQTPATKLVAVLATVGFLDALSSLVRPIADVHQGWALTVVVLVNGLQAAAAVGALLMGAGVVTERAPSAGKGPATDQYAQAAQYYGRYAQRPQPSDTQQRAGSATAQSHQQQRAPQVQQAQQSQQAGAPPKYGDYADYVGGNERTTTFTRPPTPPQGVRPPGMPSAGQAQAPAAGHPPEAERRPPPPPPSP